MLIKLVCLSILCYCGGCTPLTAGQQGDASKLDLSSVVTSARSIHRQMIRNSQRPKCDRLSLSCVADDAESLRALLRDYTVSALNRSGGDLKSLVADLRQIDDAEFADEMDKMGWGLKRDWDRDPPFVISRKLNVGEVVITLNHFSVGAFAIPSGVVIIQAFRKENGVYVFEDQVGDDLFGITDYKNFATLNSVQSNQLWVLVQGQIAGYMGDLERARIYVFDGEHFSEDWKPEDRLDMAIILSGSQIDVRYLSGRIYRFGGDIQNCMEEKLGISAGGLLEIGIVNHGECSDYLHAQ